MPTYTVINPATEQPVRTVPSTSAEETDAAIERAAAAQVSWRATAPGERAALLRAFAAEVGAHTEELAALEVAGSGHPIGAARWEAGQVRDVLAYYAGAPERAFGRQIPGFAMDDAVLTGVETRTSSPIRIKRGADFESPNTMGLYPAGEGAGFAGGILSAAVDGIKVAEAVARSIADRTMRP